MGFLQDSDCTRSHIKSTQSRRIRAKTGGLGQCLEQRVWNRVSGTWGLEQGDWIGRQTVAKNWSKYLPVSCQMISEQHNLLMAEELAEISY